jgi:hypothetical protein
VKIADNEPTPVVVITSWPNHVPLGGKIAVEWTVDGGPPGATNRVEWGTVADSFPKSTGSDKRAPYQVTFKAPRNLGIVYLRVQMLTTGGLHCYSDVKQVMVP